MNWEQALKKLGAGHAVWRSGWGADTYLDPVFAIDGSAAAPEDYPYTDEQGNRFRIVKRDRGNASEPYDPTDEDTASTEWELV